MPKLPECNNCLLYHRRLDLNQVCILHPQGVEASSCLDFRDKAPEVSYYNGEAIVQPKQTKTKEGKLELLDNHPFFTGICPKCGYTFDRDYTSRIHFDCPSCGWVDNSI